MIGFQFILLLMWCRPRRDRVLTSQLAKMEIQLDLLRDEITKLNESKVRPIFPWFFQPIFTQTDFQIEATVRSSFSTLYCLIFK